jgi:hypothetical protein
MISISPNRVERALDEGHQLTLWRIEVAPVPGLSNVATPTRPIITIPITLYMDMGMVMIREKGVPRDGAMGGSIGSTSATKPVAVAV